MSDDLMAVDNVDVISARMDAARQACEALTEWEMTPEVNAYLKQAIEYALEWMKPPQKRRLSTVPGGKSA